MPLNKIIERAVAIIDTTTSTLQVPVTHAAWTSNAGAFGAPAFAAGVTRQAIVEDKVSEIRMPGGQVLSVKAVVMFLRPIAPNGATGRREPIDPRDKITLPSGYTGPIINIDGGLDDPSTSRPYFLRVFLG